MADSDRSILNLRYNQITQGLEGFGGGTPQWTPLVLLADGGISQLTGNVTAGPGSGSQAATVVSVGGSTAANVHSAELAANAATAVNTASTIVKRSAGNAFQITSINNGSDFAVLDIQGSHLVSSTGGNMVGWGGTTLDINTHRIVNVVDPTSAQDAATKNYVDTHGATPAGANTQVQFNNAGAFGASANLTWDGTQLTINGDIISNVNTNIGTNSGNANFTSAGILSLVSSSDITASPGRDLTLAIVRNLNVNVDNNNTGLPQLVMNAAHDITFDTANNDKFQVNVNPSGIVLMQDGTPAIVDMQSTTQGFYPPRMTTTQRDAISAPGEGLVVYNTTTHKLNVFTGSVWEAVTSA